MATHLTRPGHEPTQATWNRLEQLLVDVAGLAESARDGQTFFSQTLQRVVEAVAADAGIVWLAGEGADLHVAAAVNAREVELDAALAPEHRTLVASVLSRGRAEILAPQSIAAGKPRAEADASNATPWQALLSPIRSEGQCIGMLELLCDPRTDDAPARLTLELLESVAELCADFERRRRLRDLQHRQEDWSRLDSLARIVHRSLDLRDTAYAVANDGRQFLHCDRLTVLVQRGARMRVVAVSGVASPDRRSNSGRLVEKLGDVVAAGGLPLLHPDPANPLPPQVRQALQDYLDTAHSRGLYLLPLQAPDEPGPARPFAALVIEQFSAELDAGTRRRAAALSGHAGTALRNAQTVSKIPCSRLLLRWWAARPSTTSRFRRVAAALLVAGLGGLCLIPADFTIEARGALQPALRRDVFAPDDGIVDELAVAQHAAVRRGQKLLVLRNPQLDLEFKRVFGEIATARERLAALQTARIEAATGSSGNPGSNARLSGEETEVKTLLASLQRQYDLLKNQQAELTVCSPIDGQVLTWDVEHLLQNRPVQRGQTLLAVADPQGSWSVELDVPDKRAGHLIAARRTLGPDLPVTYILATDPGVTCTGTIGRVALSTEPAESSDPVVRVSVDVGQNKPQQPRPGATVTAKIYCGRRTLAYVWLHELIDAVRTYLFF